MHFSILFLLLNEQSSWQKSKAQTLSVCVNIKQKFSTCFLFIDSFILNNGALQSNLLPHFINKRSD